MSIETTLSNVEILTVTPEHREQMRQECDAACRRTDEEFCIMLKEYCAQHGIESKLSFN